MKLLPKSKLRRLTLLAAAPIALIGLYGLSIIVRVSFAEQEYFGRSTLIPVCLYPPKYDEPSCAASFDSPTYKFVRPNGQTVKVHKQLINGFQHAYGSALADYELGNDFSDWLFRANEYAESYVFCRKTCGTLDYSLDTRKDLANNSIGRAIGRTARKQRLMFRTGYDFVLQQTLESSDEGIIYPHLKDPRVAKLPSEEQFGCYGLYLSNPKLY